MDQAKRKAFWKILKGRLFFAASLLGACFVVTHWVLPLVRQPTSAITLDNVGSRQLLRLRKNFDAGSVHGLNIRIRGHLNGTAVMRLFDAETPSKIYQDKIIGSGDVDTRMGGDWYSDDCRVEYNPLSATTGALKVEYIFKSSKVKAKNHK